MKSRALWAFVAVAALMLAAAYWWQNKGPTPTSMPVIASSVAKPAVAAPNTTAPATITQAAPVPTATTKAMAAPANTSEKKPKPVVDIQDGKTIDFSTGVAVVKDDARQKALIDKAAADMESALQSVSFASSPPPKAEPTPAPPKP